MGERGEEGVARPREKGNGERGESLPISFFPWPRDSLLTAFSRFATARQNSLKNPDFRTSGEGGGCFAVLIRPRGVGGAEIAFSHLPPPPPNF